MADEQQHAAPLSAAEIEQIRERAENATPGPWHAHVLAGESYARIYATDPDDDVVAHVHESIGGFMRMTLSEINAPFVAAARTDIPRLLATAARDLAAAARVVRADPRTGSWRGEVVDSFGQGYVAYHHWWERSRA